MNQSIEFKSLDKSIRKRMVIDAAIKVFHQKGYRTATLDDVANELGLTKTALYHYISSKENLLSQIYIQAMENFFSTVHKIADMDLSPPEKLRYFVRHHLKNIVIQNLAMFTVFFSEENQLPERDFQKIRREKRRFTQVVEDIIEEGKDQGYFRGVNAKLQANAIIGMCNWLYRWYKPNTSSFTPDEIEDEFINLIENGLTQPNGQATKLLETAGSEDQEPKLDRKRQLLEELRQNSDRMRTLIDELENL